MRLGERLIARGKLNPADLERALAAQREVGELLGRLLVRLGLVAEEDVAAALAEQLEVPLVRAAQLPAQPPALGALNPAFLRAHLVVPLADPAADTVFAAAEPQRPQLRQALRVALGAEPKLALGLESELAACLRAWFEAPEEEAAETTELTDPAASGFLEQLKELALEAPVIQWVNQTLAQALAQGASDIHLEPFEDRCQVRFRLDGELVPQPDAPAELVAAIVSRVKLLAHLDIAERRLPQDGRFSIKLQGRQLDVRVSTAPVRHGESVVLRLLERREELLSLDALAFDPDTLAALRRVLAAPHGMLIVTGPTGSGKSTTLYAALRALDATRLKILTVEDPVEYELPGINQVQVQETIGLSFAAALRAFLRQDPDVIMVGEMRDEETARIAVQAALTGHLVLSTLHTNTAAGAAVRLHDLGVPRYLITSALIAVLAQRLVRRLCPHCRTPLSRDEWSAAAELLGVALPAAATPYRAAGCAHCRGSGYRGRLAVHELLVITPDVRRAILAGGDEAAIDAAAPRRRLRDDAAAKVWAGLTTVEEAARVLAGD